MGLFLLGSVGGQGNNSRRAYMRFASTPRVVMHGWQWCIRSLFLLVMMSDVVAAVSIDV
jgi:hypothetical protein